MSQPSRSTDGPHRLPISLALPLAPVVPQARARGGHLQRPAWMTGEAGCEAKGSRQGDTP